MLELLHERHAVRQAGQRVVVRHVVDARLRRMAVADVAHDRHAQRFAVAHHRAHDELDRDALAVLVEQHALVGRLLARRDHRRDLRDVVGRGELHRPVAEQLVERVADQLAQRRVRVDDQAVLVEDDAFGGGLHELGEPLLRFAQRLLDLAVLGDVGDQHEGADGFAAGVQVRQQVHLDLARAAVGRVERALVGDRPALGGHLVDLRLDPPRGLLADHLGKGQADDRLLVAAEGLRIRLVRELAFQVARAVVGDQHRHVVGEQAEQPGLGLRGCLRRGRRGHVAQQADELRRGAGRSARARSSAGRRRRSTSKVELEVVGARPAPRATRSATARRARVPSRPESRRRR